MEITGVELESIIRGWSSEKAGAGENADLIEVKPENNTPSAQLIKLRRQKLQAHIYISVKNIRSSSNVKLLLRHDIQNGF